MLLHTLLREHTRLCQVLHKALSRFVHSGQVQVFL